MINQHLKDLTLIEQVDGIAVYSISNILLDSWVRQGAGEKVFEQISLHYLQIFALLESGVKTFNEIVVTHDRGLLYARALPDILLLVIARTPLEIALIRLIINVKITDLLNSRQLQKAIKKLADRSPNFLDKKFLDETERDLLKKLEK